MRRSNRQKKRQKEKMSVSAGVFQLPPPRLLRFAKQSVRGFKNMKRHDCFYVPMIKAMGSQYCIFIIIFLGCIASQQLLFAWERSLFEDEEIVKRSEWIVVGRFKPDSIHSPFVLRTLFLYGGSEIGLFHFLLPNVEVPSYPLNHDG